MAAPPPPPPKPIAPGGSTAGALRRILLIRHAECEMNLKLDRFIGGRSNASPLTPLGVAQASALGARLAAAVPAFASIHASTAVRAVDTAAAIASAAGLDPASAVITSPQLLELDMGAWEGADRAACYSPSTLAAIAADPTGWAPPGGGESQGAVEERMASYVSSSILPGLTPGGPPAVLVGHGLAIKCLLRRVVGADPSTFAIRNVRLDNTSITEVGVAGGLDAGWWWGNDGKEADGPVDGPVVDGLKSSPPPPPPRDAWHVLRVNDAAHIEGPGGGGGEEERVGK